MQRPAGAPPPPRTHKHTQVHLWHIENSCFAVTADSWKVLTGLGPVWGRAGLMGSAFSPDSSSCLVMSSVVKRLDSSPRMWIMASLFEGFGWKEKPDSDCYLACFFILKGPYFTISNHAILFLNPVKISCTINSLYWAVHDHFLSLYHTLD